ncbi:MAG: hypothetical protein WCB62_17875, partial [Pseudolabrys sp.]|jgi:hypothetical protein
MNARFTSQSDIRGYGSNVCFVPIGEIRACRGHPFVDFRGTQQCAGRRGIQVAHLPRKRGVGQSPLYKRFQLKPSL